MAATRVNLLSAAGRFALEPAEAEAEIDRVQRCVRKQWRGEVKRHGGTKADLEEIASAFDYPGFEYD